MTSEVARIKSSYPRPPATEATHGDDGDNRPAKGNVPMVASALFGGIALLFFLIGAAALVIHFAKS